eukprot:3874135-Rhodomonas_salina.1
MCAVAEAGRVYKHTKRMKEKMANNKLRKSQPAAKGTPEQELVKVLLEHEIQDIADEDDLEHAFGQEELHMDFAHSISLGHYKELYYLLFVVGGRNFMWVTPTTTLMEPEDLLRDFLSVLNLLIGKIRTVNEFTASTKFKAFCQKRAMVLCPSAAYTHTMQARHGAEGAVSICKNQNVQSLARGELTSSVAVNDQVQLHVRRGARPPSLLMLHGGKTGQRPSTRVSQQDTCGLWHGESFPWMA